MEANELFQISETHILHESKLPKTRIGFVYLLSVGLIGVEWIALLVSLTDLAEAAGLNTSDASYLLYAKGFGAILAASSAGYVYDRFVHIDILSISMIFCAVLLILLGLNSSSVMLYIYYFLFGFFALTIDTGSIICLILLFDKEAGLWIGAGAQISVYLYASASTLIFILTSSVKYE